MTVFSPFVSPHDHAPELKLSSAEAKAGTMSDREKAGLHGPVRTCGEETIYPPSGDRPERSFITKTEYSSEGQILRTSRRQPGGQEWISTRTYDSQGRLLNQTSGNPGGPSLDQTYSYDKGGRLTGIRYGDNAQPVRFEYDAQGHKTKIETLDPRPAKRNVAYGGLFWEGSELPFGRSPDGGTLTTIYDAQDVATEGQLRNSAGQLVSRIVRTFDGNGRITSEKVIVEKPELLIPPELPAEHNEAQKKALGAFIAANMYSGEVSYSYDAQGRMTEKRKRGGVFGEEVTSVTYNERGDKATERTTSIVNPDHGREYSLNEDGTMIPVGAPQPAPPPRESETRYTYQYEGYGNWTERTVNSRYSANETFRPSTTYRRTLTYY